MLDFETIRRQRLRVVILARKISEGRAFLKAAGLPAQRPAPVPHDAHFDWSGWWLYGYPPPQLVVDPHMEPEQVRGADLAVLVMGRSPDGSLWARIVGQSPVGLMSKLREGAAADLWQPRKLSPRADLKLSD